MELLRLHPMLIRGTSIHRYNDVMDKWISNGFTTFSPRYIDALKQLSLLKLPAVIFRSLSIENQVLFGVLRRFIRRIHRINRINKINHYEKGVIIAKNSKNIKIDCNVCELTGYIIKKSLDDFLPDDIFDIVSGYLI